MDLQPREFFVMCKAYKDARERRHMETSYYVSWVIAPHLKKPIEPRKIASAFVESATPTVDELRAEKERFLKMLKDEGEN